MDKARADVLSYNFFFPIPLALCILIIRRLLEKYCFEPVGVSLGIKPLKRTQNERNSDLITTLKNTNLLSPIQVSNLNKYFDTTSQFKEENLGSNQKMSRFSRSCGHFIYYLVEFTHGILVLWNKPWPWNIGECWTDHPNQKITTDIWIFYLINLAYYWSLLIKIFLHKRRKDFTESVIHHSVAILLLYISLVTNTYRIGSFALTILLVSDIFLEMAKLFKYLNLELQSAACFAIFALVWTVTRLIMYPFWILYQSLLEGPSNIVMTPSMYLLNVLLCTIAVLNIYWTAQIYKVLRKALRGQDFGDDRSDTNESEEEENPNKKQK